MNFSNIFVLLSWLLLSMTCFVNAASNSTTKSSRYLKTSSLLTCMENSQFTASYFDVRFYPHNQTVVFKVDATTTISDKVILRVELLAYGLSIFKDTFDLCSIGEASVCPLNAGRFDLSSSYQITDSSLTNEIPGIAYTVPDLDAQVRVLIYAQDDTSYSTPLGCVLAILSNDKTVQTKYAAWPIAAISGVGILTSAFVSVIGYTVTAAHIASNSISLFIYFQNLAITSMMGVSRVPPIAAAWTQNFQWSMGIINVEFMQNIFDWYVQATNGVSTVVVANKDILSISVQKRMLKSLLKRAVSVASSSDYDFDSILNNSTMYTSTERNTTEYTTKILVLRGIERVSFKAGIELSNFFLTGVVFTLFFLFCLICSLIFFKALLEVLIRARWMSETTNFFQYRKNWASIMKGTLYRMAVIAFPQICLLTIWEFTQIDSPAIVVDAAVIFIVFFGLLVYGTLRVVLQGRQSMRLYKTPAYLLYGDTIFLNRFGFLYSQFHADKYWWLLPLLCYSFFRSLFVAVLQNQGKAQAMIVFLIELIYFGCLCWVRPYLDKRTNIFNISIHLVNLINSILFLFFSNIFSQPPVVSSVMAVVLFVLNAVFALFLLIFTIVTCTIALLHRNPDARYQPMRDDRVSFIPKLQVTESIDALTGNYFKDDTELMDMGKTVMDTNETEQERTIRLNTFGNPSRNRLLFDDASSTFTDSTNLNRQVSFGENNSDAPIQPASAVLGNSNNINSTRYQRVAGGPNASPTKRGEHLRKPETSFYTGNNNSNSNPFSSRSNNTFL